MKRTEDPLHGEGLPPKLFLAASVVFAVVVGLAFSRIGGLRYFEPLGVPTASRLL